MTKLEKLFNEYKKADAKCRACANREGMDVEEYMALHDVKKEKADAMVREIVDALERGESVLLSDNPTLRKALSEGEVD